MLTRREFATALFVSPAMGAAAASGREPLQAYNARDFGTGRWQRVEIRTWHGSRELDTWQIFRAWRNVGGQADTVTVLEKEPGLRGTAIHMREAPSAAAPEVSILFPVAAHPVKLAPGAFHESLLGSGFSHADLAWRLYPRIGSPLPQAAYRFDPSCSLLLEAVYSRLDGSGARRVVIISHRRIEQVPTPTSQLLEDEGSGLRSRMDLVGHGRCGDSRVKHWISLDGLRELVAQVRAQGEVAT